MCSKRFVPDEVRQGLAAPASLAEARLGRGTRGATRAQRRAAEREAFEQLVGDERDGRTREKAHRVRSRWTQPYGCERQR